MIAQPAILFHHVWFNIVYYARLMFSVTAKVLDEVGSCILVVDMLLQTCGACDAISNGAADLTDP